MARGEYVYFVDNDDWIGKDALKRLYGRAERDEADIVIGQVVGEGKFVARTVFKRDRKDVTLEWPPLLRLLTPHKLFRKAMLDEHAIRFPEGRRRLEDHVFTMHAYFHAQHISVLARYPCYHWVLRDDGENAFDRRVRRRGLLRQRARGARPHRRAHGAGPAAGAGAQPLVPREDARPRGRPRLRQAAARVPAAAVRGDPRARARALHRGCRRVALVRLTLRSRLLRAGRYEALEALARFEAGLETEVSVVKIEPEEDEAVNLTLEARIPGLRFEQRRRHRALGPARGPAGPPGAGGARGRRVDRSYADVLIWSARDGTEFCCARTRRRGSRTARRC